MNPHKHKIGNESENEERKRTLVGRFFSLLKVVVVNDSSLQIVERKVLHREAGKGVHGFEKRFYKNRL
jgi:hypothetical protein